MEQAFNNQFLSNILGAYENNTSLIVDKFETSACEPEGNFTSEINRLTVYGTKKVGDKTESYTSTIIVKCVPKNEDRAKLFSSKIAFENEVHAYNTIIPALAKYALGETLPVPACIHAHGNLVVLQDLKSLDFSTIDRLQGGFNLNQCRAVVQALAKLHAASIVMSKKEPQTLNKLAKLTKEPMFEGGDPRLMESQKAYIDCALKIFNSIETKNTEVEEAVKVLSELSKNLNTVMEGFFKTSPKELFVISHGDAWVLNVMFNSKEEVRLIDLQLMRFNSVAADLCYLFYVNLKQSLWKEHKQSLLDEYLDALQKNTKQQGVNLDDVLTKKWLADEMVRFSKYGLMRALWLMPMFFYKMEDLHNLTWEMLFDTDTMLTKTGPKFVDRLKELVLNYIKQVK